MYFKFILAACIWLLKSLIKWLSNFRCLFMWLNFLRVNHGHENYCILWLVLEIVPKGAMLSLFQNPSISKHALWLVLKTSRRLWVWEPYAAIFGQPRREVSSNYLKYQGKRTGILTVTKFIHQEIYSSPSSNLTALTQIPNSRNAHMIGIAAFVNKALL